MKKEYLAATCALELPKGNDLRVKLTTLKVEIGQIWDDTKVIDADLIDETTFEKHMAKIADVLTRSKMLRVQARAVAREMASRRIAGANLLLCVFPLFSFHALSVVCRDLRG